MCRRSSGGGCRRYVSLGVVYNGSRRVGVVGLCPELESRMRETYTPALMTKAGAQSPIYYRPRNPLCPHPSNHAVQGFPQCASGAVVVAILVFFDGEGGWARNTMGLGGLRMDCRPMSSDIQCRVGKGKRGLAGCGLRGEVPPLWPPARRRGSFHAICHVRDRFLKMVRSSTALWPSRDGTAIA